MKTHKQQFRYAAEPVVNDLGRRINRLAGDIARIERNAPIEDSELEWLAKVLDNEGMLGGLNRTETIEALKVIKNDLLSEYNGQVKTCAERERACSGTNIGDLLREARS